jgi:hypothetical protein
MKGLRIFLLFAAWLAFTFSLGCGGSSSTTPTTVTTTNPPAASGNNVASILVNGGPVGGYADAAFVSVTVCVPGTSTCQTVDGVLVDTGSSGLRILSSALTIALPQQTASGGEPVVECFPFVSGYTWGPVQTADVEMASEKASSVPIQVLSDTDYMAPTSCTDSGTSSDTLDSLGANGIVGVGLFIQDCGSYCETVQTAPGNFNIYYECASSTSCQPIGESLAAQVPNPVSLFPTDNNGVIVELPSISGGEEASATGSLVFGIGTESNNALGSATIYSANGQGNFTTVFNGTTYPEESFIDSGSNGYFFPDASIAQCGNNSEAPGFYCPSTTENLSASNQGANGTSGTVDFSVANALTLFNSDDNAFSQLGGTYTGAFDWGLPFFFGQDVYVGIQNSTYADGYWAY